ncbi:MAG TPA: substrate-binding domain-containing protein, partial [Anaerolineales bacterium]|nr:substrate-binding domain-containing protein [Anaerolineales bacterium]
AIGLLRAMQERGLHAPDDVAVVGFDDIQLARYMRPTLSTVGASRVAWGAAAAKQLIDFLEHETPFSSERIATHLIQRESSTRVLVGQPETSAHSG